MNSHRQNSSTSAALLKGSPKAIPIMFDERHIKRHQLPYFLKVFNHFTDQPIGYLGNVSEDGLMLISSLPLLVGPDFELQLKVIGRHEGVHLINLTASCLWCHEDETPGSYDSGFVLLRAPREYGQLVRALRNYFSFYPLGASV